jgi:hypothetical protein
VSTEAGIPDRTQAVEVPMEPPRVGRVVVDSLVVRAGPGEEHEVLEYAVADAGQVAVLPVTVQRDGLVLLLGQTAQPDGEEWARVAVNVQNHFFETIRIGWVAVSTDERKPPIAAFDVSNCPAISDGYLDQTPFPHALVTLTCFGDAELRLEGVLRRSTATCPPADWLRCGWSTVPSVGGLPVFIDPQAGIGLPADGSTVTVVGHFDDARSSLCDDDLVDPQEGLMAVLRCRTSFVVDRLGSPPISRIPIAAVRPVLESGGTETYADGEWTRHLLRVVNWIEVPGEMFAAAPDLPECGSWEPAARAWVRIFDEAGQELALFCQPGEPEGLQALSFVRPTGTTPPAQVYVEIFDRMDDLVYRSDPIALSP